MYSRDTLGDLGTVEQLPLADAAADPDDEIKSDGADAVQSSTLARQKDARTLDELRFVPGDYLCIAVMLPKNVQVPGEPSATSPSLQKGPAPTNGWKNAGVGGVGRGALGSSGQGSSAPAAGRGGGHWRGGSDAPPQPARGRGERGGGVGARGERDGGRFRDERERERDRDRRPPLPRRESPPPRAPRGDRERGAQRDRRSLSLSRSRSPPRRRR